MILKGNQRAHGRELALHLMNVEDNEHAVVHELRGFLASDLMGAFKEVEAISLGTKCQQYLFSLSLNPPQLAKVPVQEFEKVVGEIEQRLGLSDLPRAIVFHEKNGRRHAHCVWSRIDVTRMRAINLSHFKRRLMDISRELYLEHSWEMPAGLRDHKDYDPLNYSHAEARQAKRVKRDPQELKELFKSCWAASDSRTAFAAALWEKGFCLARGDRRGFVAVDVQGEVYSLSRWCDVKAKVLRARLSDGAELPNVDEAIALLNNSARQDNGPASHNHSDRQRHFLRDHEQKLSELVARQREERRTLSKAQEVRRVEEIRFRQSRLPTGLKAVWAQLAGMYKPLVDELALEAQACEARDRIETEALIERHLAERRELGRELAHLEAQYAFEQEFLDRSASLLLQTYQPDPRQPLVLPREDVPFTPNQLKRQPDLILTHISDKQARFNRADILRGLAEFIDDPLELRAASDRVLASQELVRVADSEKEELTTLDYQAVEKQLSNCATEMARSGGFHVDIKHINRGIKRENTKLQKLAGANLSDEQITAIRHILAPNQMSAVVGLAGSGKSTLLSVAREAWEQQGYRVYGAALAGKAADSLQTASGIPSRTLASLEASWKSGYEPVAYGDVVVIDEAGMAGTRQLARVAEQLQKRGCKLVLVGDPDQLQPIQAGTPFRDIVDKNNTAHLTEIRRQNTKWQRQASRDLADGHAEMAIQSYADHGSVHEGQDRDQAVAALVEDYMTDWQEHGQTKSRLALAHRRKDVHAINQAIKSARTVESEPASGILFDTDHGPRVFSNGDRILFTRNDRDLGVRNGMLGTIEAVSDEQLTIRLDPDESSNRRKLTFSPQEFPAIDHGFAVSIHRSQGCTVDRSFVLSSRTLDKNLAYVALTRHREETGFYTAPEIASKRISTDPEMFAPRDFRARVPSRTR
ncbi:MAG: AAA family ATPase [bacterium]|nr:AAA family ATPase [bacterium]